MATEPKSAAEPKKTTPAKSSGKSAKPAESVPVPKSQDPKGADQTGLESRLSALESGLDAAEQRLAKRAAALEARIGAMEQRETSAPKVRMPAGLVDGTRQAIDRAADWIRHNPVTALILIVAFLLVAIFS